MQVWPLQVIEAVQPPLALHVFGVLLMHVV
jgi:hypothetical protein